MMKEVENLNDTLVEIGETVKLINDYYEDKDDNGSTGESESKDSVNS